MISKQFLFLNACHHPCGQTLPGSQHPLVSDVAFCGSFLTPIVYTSDLQGKPSFPLDFSYIPTLDNSIQSTL